jgi:arginyl-tRNA synthetase
VTPALLDDLVRAAAREVLATRGLDPAALPADPGVTRARHGHGDYATAVALRTAGRVGVAPRELAGWLADALVERPEVAHAEVAGPGFLNLRMTTATRSALVAAVLAAGESYGTDPDGAAVEEAADAVARGASADLVAAVGVDAARYALLRSPTRTVGDVGLLARRVPENPVFLVQYTHARLVSLVRNATDLGVRVDPEPALLTRPCEGELVDTIGEFPAAVRTGEPHRVARHLEALAAAVLDFHDSCAVLPSGDEDVTDLHRVRLAAVVAARQVLANGLGLLGVSAPERI